MMFLSKCKNLLSFDKSICYLLFTFDSLSFFLPLELTLDKSNYRYTGTRILRIGTMDDPMICDSLSTNYSKESEHGNSITLNETTTTKTKTIDIDKENDTTTATTTTTSTMLQQPSAVTMKANKNTTSTIKGKDSATTTTTTAAGNLYAVPWVEKFRPRTLDDVLGNVETVRRLRAIAKDGNIPNLILCGPPGTGTGHKK
jgi:ATP-dependent Clp protease ATP-binding subunit ClpA